MKIKRFVANNMRQALQCVRKEQGPDAVILSNRRVESGIEVVAAVDYDETLMPHALQGKAEVQTPEGQPVDDLFKQNNVERESFEYVALERDSTLFSNEFDETSESVEVENSLDEGPFSSATDGPKWSRETALGDIRQEINGMRSLLEDQLSSFAWKDEIKRDPFTVNVIRRYAAMGVDPDIAREIAERSTCADDEGDSVEQADKALAAALPLSNDNVLDEGGVIAVIGPTGVGKTTSIAKMAARFALRHGRDQVALVSTDSFRIGAQEQLATFAQILDVPVHRVADRTELGALLHSLTDKKLVLIDTAGVSQRVEGLSKHLQAFNPDGAKIKTYLALATNGHSQTLDEVVRKFGCVPLDGCILTKIDEASSLGAVLSSVIRNKLPIVFLANGQRVPEDLHIAAGRSIAMVNYATRLMHESGQFLGDEFMARNYGEVRTHAHA